MSLRVWLPLTKDTQNHGLMELPTPWAIWSKNEGGKIGQYCYSDCAIYHKEEEWLDNKWSLSCWVKSSNWGTYNDILMCKNTSESTQSQFYFSIIGGTTLNLGTNGGNGGVSYNYTFSINTWYHVVATYDGTIACLYINGEKVKTQSYPTAKLNGMNNFCIGCRSSNATGTSATGYSSKKFNDVRVYDHALSSLEVKHISQGLILHYPLSDKYLEDTTNLVTSISAGGQTTVNNNIVTTSGTDKDTYFTINLSEDIVVGTQYTFSCDAEIPSGTWRFPLGNQNNTTLDFVLHNGHNVYTFVANDTSWGTKRIFMDDNGGTTNSARSTGLQTKIYNFQLEKKDHETGFAGYGVSRTNAIIYDTSGYGNNGEIYAYDSDGKIEVSSDTLRYSMSTHVISSNTATSSAAGTTYLYGHCQLTNPNQMTVAFWCKPIKGYNNSTTQGQFCTTAFEFNNQSVGADYQYSAMNHRDGTVDINDSSSTAQCRPHINFIPNEWHHYVITYDGQNGSTYQDGILYEAKSFESSKQLDSFIGIVIGFSNAGGVWRKNDSYYSDFRVYATALSAEDVKDLYELGATIDTNGVLSTYEFTEQ